MTWQLVTANRLRDGAVVFLGARSLWTERVGEGLAVVTEDEANALLRAAEAQPTLVVGPYLIEVAGQAGAWVPSRYRERIRAEGPSVGGPPETVLEGA
jgi:sulfite reductase (NADPH) hemoprotein beta-component